MRTTLCLQLHMRHCKILLKLSPYYPYHDRKSSQFDEFSHIRRRLAEILFASRCGIFLGFGGLDRFLSLGFGLLGFCFGFEYY